MIAGAISQNRRIDNLTTRTAFPRIESPDEIVILFGVHSTFTLGTSHLTTSSLIKHKCAKFSYEILHETCQPRFNLSWRFILPITT